MLEIKVFGSGCRKCELLLDDCNSITTELNIEANIQKITDQEEIFSNGVLMTPGLMVNGKLMTSGKVPVRSTLKNWIKKATEEKL